MAGTVRGRINALAQPGVTAGRTNNARALQEIFVTTWRFLDSLPNCQRIASNAGQAASGNIAPPTNTRNSGLDASPGYWDEAKNVSHGAFGVWRFNSATWPWYLFLQLDTAEGAYDISGQNAMVVCGGTITNWGGLVAQGAWGISAGGTETPPWLGTTTNQWADAPWAVAGGPRWGVAGGTVNVLPRSNNTSGSFDTNKNSGTFLCGCFPTNYDTIAGNIAFGVVADDDSFQMFWDYNNQNLWTLGGIYRYTPRVGITAPRPYCMIVDTNETNLYRNIPFTSMSTGPTVYGVLSPTYYNNNSGFDGGILVPSTAADLNPRNLVLDRLGNCPFYTTLNPSNAAGPVGAGLVGTYDEWSVLIGCYESGLTPAAIYGMLGTLDTTMYREIYNVGSSDAKSDLSRVFLGASTSLTTLKASVPWDGVTTPRSYAVSPTVSRVGVSF